VVREQGDVTRAEFRDKRVDEPSDGMERIGPFSRAASRPWPASRPPVRPVRRRWSTGPESR